MASQPHADEDSGLLVRVSQPAPVPLDAEFTCRTGELLALVGPSGSGKTSLLRCIAGLHRPRSGVVRCKGLTWFASDNGIHLPPQKRRVGLVFQQYALFPHLSARDNVASALRHIPAHARRARADALLDTVHLAGLEAHKPRQLSGGQQQRVALARALARDPTVLLLDEPFSAVDQVTRRKLQSELAQLRRRVDLPIVLVTHDLQEARMLADRMCLLHRGIALQSGTPTEVLSRPVSALAARLVDIPNIYTASVDGHDAAAEVTYVRWLDQRLEAPYRPELLPGAKLSWVIPPENVILHRRERPSRGERENPIRGQISELVVLGETTTITVRLGPAQDVTVSLSVPTHVAKRNSLDTGVEIGASLLRDGIHLMPPEEAGDLSH